MNNTKNVERLVVLETDLKNINTKIDDIEASLSNLHGKFDNFRDTIAKNFVPVSTFEEFQRTQREKNKNRILELIITSLITAVVTGLVAFFLREFGV